MIVYRFDYKYLSLPYFLYIEFKQFPSYNTIKWIMKKLQAYNKELVIPNEIISCKRHGIKIMSYRIFKDMCAGRITDIPLQTSLPFPDEPPF